METSGETELCFPQLLNASCLKPQRPHSEAMLTYIMLSSISLLIAFLNLLVIISISHFKQLHTPTNILLLSLAVSDFLMAPALPVEIMLIDGCWLFGDLMCSLYQYLMAAVTSAAVGAMILISVDRYVAICYPFHYCVEVTQKRVEVCVCLCWIGSFIFQFLVLQDRLQQPGGFNYCVGECVIVSNYSAGIADLFFSFVFPIAVILILYMRVFVVAVSQARAMRSHIAAVTQNSTKVTVKKSELKAARTLGVVILVFLLCLFPYYCVALTSQENSMNASSASYIFILTLYCSNSCLNPIIYICFYPWFRKSIRLIFTLKILEPDSSDTNIL